MRNEPQYRVIELTEPKRFSLGAGTQIASVNIKLDDIRLRDMGEGAEHSDKRGWAVRQATELAEKYWVEKFGELDDTIPDDRPVSFLTVHQRDSVTVEIWKQGPERRTVKVDLGNGS